MNRAEISINGIDYTKYLVYTPKWGNLLDERLDEAQIVLRHTKRELPFEPNDYIKFKIINNPPPKIPVKKTPSDILNEDRTLTQTKTIEAIVAKDTVENTPIGSGFYTHTIYVIEATKALERYVCDSIYFSNCKDITVNTNDKAVAREYYNDFPHGALIQFVSIPLYYQIQYGDPENRWQQDNYYIAIPAPIKIYEDAGTRNDTKQDIQSAITRGLCYIRIYDRFGKMLDETEFWDDRSSTGEFYYNYTHDFYTPYIARQSDYYEIQYIFPVSNTERTILKIYIEAYRTNIIPKLWTVSDAITRCCELALPLRKGLGGNDLGIRFKLNGVTYTNGIASYASGQAVEFDKVLIPSNFALTRSTLREQLQQIGYIIHAEPRAVINRVENVNGRLVLYFEIIYDKFGQMNYSDISDKPFLVKELSQNIEDYATALDSSVDNLVSTMGYMQGVTTEPYDYGAISLRSETTYAQLQEDEQTIIPTRRKIQEIVKLYYVDSNGDHDITKYAFESAIYVSLSSYGGVYPLAKNTALKYTQGEKNISGLFFKDPNPISSVFNKYSIENVITAAGGTIPNGNNYLACKFRIVYKPVYSQRLRQYKAYIDNNPSTLIYNQGGNAIESKYYGEHLKGIVARLGNVEKVYSYKLAFLSDIPKAGQLFDDNYYIAAVNCELNTTFIRCTIALSKDFNRLSQYIGINSIKRMYEVSEKQAIARDSIFCENLLVSHTAQNSDSNTLLTKRGFSSAIEATFDGSIGPAVDYATVYFSDVSGNVVTPYAINLPVVTTAEGNAMAITFSLEDNYSAGDRIIMGNDGRYNQGVSYGDYFGRGHYLHFNIKAFDPFPGGSATYDGLTNNADILPQQPTYSQDDSYITTGDYPIKYRKMGEEVPSITYQINIRTDGKIIIGSGFAQNCPLILKLSQSRTPPKIGFFSERIPKFAEKINPNALIGLADITVTFDIDAVRTKIDTAAQTPLIAKSWAIFTPSDTTTYQTEDENGNAYSQVVENGSDILLAENLNSGETFLPIYLTIKKERG